MSSQFLLLQAREEGDPMLAQERRCFSETAGLDEGLIATHNLALGPPTVAAVHEHRALLIGGSGEYLVSEGNLPGFDEILEIFRDVAETGFPTFASCFGFQMMVEALGGKVVFDPANAEVGTFEVTLTAEGRRDSLLGILPPTFLAQQGHKDRAERLPPGVTSLAASARCPFQAFRLPGKPVWATQFHPELTRETNLERFETYRAKYRGHLEVDGEGVEKVSLAESPEPSRLLVEFLRRLD